MKKLKTLKSVAPSPQWKKSNRQLLMIAIKGGTGREAGKTWAQEVARILFPWKVAKLALRPALILAAIFGLVLSSALGVSASERALPGDALYPLKIATERMQIVLTFDKEEQAKMHVELAGKRINEVKKIKENISPAKDKSQKINFAIDKFQKEIEEVKNNLENLAEKSQPAEAVEIAKIVETKVNEYQETLAQTTVELGVNGEIAEKIKKGLDLTEKTSDRALEVLIAKGVVPPEEDVLRRIERRLKTTEVKMAQVEEQIINNLPTPVQDLPRLSTLPSVLQEAVVLAKATLVQAREALNQKEVSIAFNKILEGRELVRQVEQLASEVALSLPSFSEVVPSNTVENSELIKTNPTEPTAEKPTAENPTTNTNTMKVYPKPVVSQPVASSPEEPTEPVIDESKLRVEIDLRQEPVDFGL